MSPHSYLFSLLLPCAPTSTAHRELRVPVQAGQQHHSSSLTSLVPHPSDGAPGAGGIHPLPPLDHQHCPLLLPPTWAGDTPQPLPLTCSSLSISPRVFGKLGCARLSPTFPSERGIGPTASGLCLPLNNIHQTEQVSGKKK